MADLFLLKSDHDILIEANQVLKHNVTAVTLWCGGVEVVERDALDANLQFAAINVPTINGMKRAQEGDWIIRRTTGDFYPLTEEKFGEMFDPNTI